MGCRMCENGAVVFGEGTEVRVVALSDDENEILSRLEQDLMSDAQFSETLKAYGGHPGAKATADTKSEQSRPVFAWSPRRVAAGGLFVLVGLSLLLVGVTIGYNLTGMAIGFVGVLLMVGGAYYAMTSAKSKKASERSDDDSFGERQRRAFHDRRSQ